MVARRHLSLAFSLSIGLVCFMHVTPSCFAQDSLNADANVAADCPTLQEFPQLATSVVVSCQKGDSIEVTMPLKPDAQGRGREKRVRGQYEFREYRIPQADQQEHAFENLMQLVPIAGFVVKYSADSSLITAQKGDTWMLVNFNGDSYDVSVVRDTQMHCTAIKNDAGAISHEMETHNHAAIYGLQFSPENHIVEGTSSDILSELLKYLKQAPEGRFVIESHKFSSKGTEEDDLEITRQRANAVVDWLVAQGIPPGRLQARPFGRGKPLTENDTPTEIQCNERIELAKAATRAATAQ
jgi:outer membrane protein OmpA-like peptidoglycan-associated protein